ncbi:MAG: hypothetical protein EOP60_15980, partial [Sphingomonadales bacterium]
MYSEIDIANAVEAGVLSPEAANAFRNHVAEARSAPAVDEEHFRLLTGFNDIFVSIAAALILVAVAWIGFYIGSKSIGMDSFEGPRQIGISVAIAGAAVAGTSWVLAEYFTRQRRMALPSILLLLGFTGGVFAPKIAPTSANTPWLAEQFNLTTEMQHRQLAGTISIITGVVTAAAAWLHWRRFMVPITVAVGAMALVAVAVGAIMAFIPGAQDAAAVTTPVMIEIVPAS